MKRDVSADRHDTWGGDAMAADAASDERGGCGRRNRAVPIPRRWDQASRDEREATVARKPGAPRRPRISRKTIARGTPVVRLPCGCLRAQSAFLLHARLAGAASIRCSPRPLVSRGASICKTRTLRAARIQSHIFSAVMPRLDRGIQYAAAFRLKHCGLWNTGSPGRAGR